MRMEMRGVGAPRRKVKKTKRKDRAEVEGTKVKESGHKKEANGWGDGEEGGWGESRLRECSVGAAVPVRFVSGLTIKLLAQLPTKLYVSDAD